MASHTTAESTTRQTHPVYQPVRHEDPLAFEQMRSEMVASWRPATTTERQLVEIAASAFVRIQRAEAFETSLLTGVMEAIQAKHGKPVEISRNDNLGCAVALGYQENDLAWKNIDRYRRAAHTDYHRAIDQLRRLQNDRKNEPIRALRAQREQDAYLRQTTAAGNIPAAGSPAGRRAEGRREPIPFPVQPSPPPVPESAGDGSDGHTGSSRPACPITFIRRRAS